MKFPDSIARQPSGQLTKIYAALALYEESCEKLGYEKALVGVDGRVSALAEWQELKNRRQRALYEMIRRGFQ